MSNVTNMSSLFRSTSFNFDIGSWDVSSVRNMGGMFNTASDFNQPLNLWNVRNVNHMNAMFYNEKAFNQPLKFNTEKVIDMFYMFLIDI